MEISDLEILLLLAFSADGRALPIPFSQFYKDDEQKESYSRGCRGNYRNKLLHLVLKQGDEDKKLYRDKIILKKAKEDSIPLENYLAFKKTCLLHDWIKEDKDIKTIEQENGLYGGNIQLLGEGFSWLADNLMEIAKNEGWRKGREEDLNKIKLLSERLIDGVEEEGLSLSRMHIPGLSRSYVRALLREGYDNKKCLEELSEKELGKVVPKRLAGRIKRRFSGKTGKVKEREFQDDSPMEEDRDDRKDTEDRHKVSPYMKDDSQRLTTILEIDKHRPDRIIFMGKEVKVTTIGFSLICLLAQHRCHSHENGNPLSPLPSEGESWGEGGEILIGELVNQLTTERSWFLYKH